MSSIISFGLIIILSFICLLSIALYLTKTVEDFIKGINLILVKRLRIGDIVCVNNIEGTIENLSLKTITIKDEQGNYHYLRNYLVKQVENKSRNFVFCPVKVVVPKEKDITETIKDIKETIKQVITETNLGNAILDDFEIYSIDKINNNDFCIEGKIKTNSCAKELVKKEIEKRIRNISLNTISMRIN